MDDNDHDFGGYATVANRLCTDGRTISPQAFKHMDGQQVPLVWQHLHDSPDNILGHASLEHRDNGDVYAKAFFNDTPAGVNSKKLVKHGDIKHLSIYANRLKETAKKVVMHGNIKEVSLVMSGANPGALIDYVSLKHGDGSVEALDDEAVIHMDLEIELPGEEETVLEHKSYQDVYDTLDDDQQALLEFMLKQALDTPALKQSDAPGDGSADIDENKKADAPEGADLEHKEGTGIVTRNAFEKNDDKTGTEGGNPNLRTLDSLTHAEVDSIFSAMAKGQTWKETFLAHVDEYGITNIELLFPDAKALDTRPEFITRRMEWVEKVLNGTRKVPWSKIKSLSADLTLETARAKGYVKGNIKKEQFFAIAKRETSPQTIYKKQKLDRDDIIDITDFDVVAWLWIEMYFMLREESARAILVGDGREIDDEDKIFEDKIRPIAHDDTFYTDVVTVDANTNPDQLVEAILRARTYYKGAGSLTAFMTNEVMTDMLLSKDLMGRRYYDSVEQLQRALRVSEIVEVEIMEGQTRAGGDILVILVNMGDYAVGSTKGGEITKFDDFDIDMNQYKYLIEGRFSGALQKHKTAQVIVRGTGTLIVVTSATPTFVSGTGVVTIPTVTGITYKNQLTNATLTAGAQTALASGETLSVKATANTGYYFPHNYDADWSFTRP